MMNFPFFDSDVAEWIGNRLGPKRMSQVAEHFQPDAFKDRAQRRDPSALQSLLHEGREKLAHILRNL
jgi:transcriptional regulator GlxA family with amidase domain